MIKDIIWVGLGGMLGSIARYLINIGFIHNNWPIPWPTFLINLSGSFLIGGLMAFSVKNPQYWRLFLVTGFCGGYTTFSSFSFENLKLWQDGHPQIALVYVLASLIGGIFCVAFGFLVTQKLLG